MIKSFDVVNHGWHHSDYFQGCGASFTRYTHAFTGIGHCAKEAFEDAVEQACQSLPSEEHDRLPVRPRGIRKTDCVPAGAGDDVYWFVTLRLEITK